MQFEALMMLAVGLVVGVFFMWWLSRQSNKNMFEQGRNAAASELATSAERVRSLQHDLEQARQNQMATEQNLKSDQQSSIVAVVLWLRPY